MAPLSTPASSLFLPVLSLPSSLPLSTSERTRRALYQRECAYGGEPAGRAEICCVSLWENNRLLRGYDAHLQSENSLKMSLPITPEAKDHRAVLGLLATMTGASDSIRTSPAQEAVERLLGNLLAKLCRFGSAFHFRRDE